MTPQTPWPALAALVISNDRAGMEEFYEIFRKRIRWSMARAVNGDDLDDNVHSVIATVISALRRGKLRDPEALPAFVAGCARHQVAAYIGTAIRTRERDGGPIALELAVSPSVSPEQAAINGENRSALRAALSSIRPRYRDLIERFYIAEDSRVEIMQALDLSSTQFALRKSRAKAKLAQALTQRRVLGGLQQRLAA